MHSGRGDHWDVCLFVGWLLNVPATGYHWDEDGGGGGEVDHDDDSDNDEDNAHDDTDHLQLCLGAW